MAGTVLGEAPGPALPPRSGAAETLPGAPFPPAPPAPLPKVPAWTRHEGPRRAPFLERGFGAGASSVRWSRARSSPVVVRGPPVCPGPGWCQALRSPRDTGSLRLNQHLSAGRKNPSGPAPVVHVLSPLPGPLCPARPSSRCCLLRTPSCVPHPPPQRRI